MSEGVRLSPGKRVLFLTKDPELIRKQLRTRPTRLTEFSASIS
jgi:hypothetical protein